MPLVILPHGIQASSKTVATLFMPFGSLPLSFKPTVGRVATLFMLHPVKDAILFKCSVRSFLPYSSSYSMLDTTLSC